MHVPNLPPAPTPAQEGISLFFVQLARYIKWY